MGEDSGWGEGGGGQDLGTPGYAGSSPWSLFLFLDVGGRGVRPGGGRVGAAV